ncbi:MAG: hypothetical protein IJ849_09155 [Selenomonadaceae bacterium]|nr:hypothetical protein [Selenomonadaceae bacterium]
MPLADLVKGIPIGNELKEIAKRNDEARHAKQELRKKAALKYHSELNAKLKPYHVRIDAKGDLAWLSQNPSHKERMHYAEKEDEVWKIIDEYVARYEAEASNTTPTNRKFSISGEKNLDAQEGKSDNKGEVTDIKGTSKFQRFVQIIFIN